MEHIKKGINFGNLGTALFFLGAVVFTIIMWATGYVLAIGSLALPEWSFLAAAAVFAGISVYYVFRGINGTKCAHCDKILEEEETAIDAQEKNPIASALRNLGVLGDNREAGLSLALKYCPSCRQVAVVSITGGSEDSNRRNDVVKDDKVGTLISAVVNANKNK